jgi:hypothetical protein
LERFEDRSLSVWLCSLKVRPMLIIAATKA